MRILLLSFYFEPDLCAGSFRSTSLASELSARLDESDDLQIITTMPNRYRSFHAEAPVLEKRGNISIRRVPLPPHRSGMLDQSRSFLFYARAVFRETTGQKYNIVFATSSRLMTAVLGALVAQRLGAQLYLDIRDIFSDTLSDIFAHKPQRLILCLVRFLEKIAIRKASRINLVSAGFLEYFRGIRSDIDYRIFTNGIDDAFLNINFGGGLRSGKNRKIILYAGNIGEGQGLDKIIPDAALSLDKDYEFWVVGDGGARPRLEARLQEKEVRNVRLMDPVSREQLVELYSQADVLFLHLNDYSAFHKVLPSKIFEYAATGKPILAGVDGYSRRFIQDHVQNAALFSPCDSVGLIGALDSLDLGTRVRAAFIEEFERSVIIRRMADDVLELARCGGK